MKINAFLPSNSWPTLNPLLDFHSFLNMSAKSLLLLVTSLSKLFSSLNISSVKSWQLFECIFFACKTCFKTYSVNAWVKKEQELTLFCCTAI